jgi:hypothetical protein
MPKKSKKVNIDINEELDNLIKFVELNKTKINVFSIAERFEQFSSLCQNDESKLKEFVETSYFSFVVEFVDENIDYIENFLKLIFKIRIYSLGKISYVNDYNIIGNKTFTKLSKYGYSIFLFYALLEDFGPKNKSQTDKLIIENHDKIKVIYNKMIQLTNDKDKDKNNMINFIHEFDNLWAQMLKNDVGYLEYRYSKEKYEDAQENAEDIIELVNEQTSANQADQANQQEKEKEIDHFIKIFFGRLVHLYERVIRNLSNKNKEKIKDYDAEMFTLIPSIGICYIIHDLLKYNNFEELCPKNIPDYYCGDYIKIKNIYGKLKKTDNNIDLIKNIIKCMHNGIKTNNEIGDEMIKSFVEIGTNTLTNFRMIHGLIIKKSITNCNKK